MLLVLSLLVPAFVLFRLWSSGSAASLRGAISRAVPSRLRTFVFAFAILSLCWLAALPFSFLDYRVNRLYGLTRQPPAEWFGAWIVQAAIATLLLSLVAASILWLVARTRVWYLYAAGGIILAMLGLAYIDPVAITPLMTSSRPLDPASFPPYTRHALRRHMRAASRSTWATSRERALRRGSKGWGAPAHRCRRLRHRVGDRARESVRGPAPSRAFAAGDTLYNALLFAGFGIVTLALAVGLADRVPFRPDDDRALALSAGRGERHAVFRDRMAAGRVHPALADAMADRFALRMTNDPIAAERSIVRTADELLIPYCTPFDVIFPDVHQPPGTRIAAIRGNPDPCR